MLPRTHWGMSDYLSHLVARGAERRPALQPRRLSLFEPSYLVPRLSLSNAMSAGIEMTEVTEPEMPSRPIPSPAAGSPSVSPMPPPPALSSPPETGTPSSQPSETGIELNSAGQTASRPAAVHSKDAPAASVPATAIGSSPLEPRTPATREASTGARTPPSQDLPTDSLPSAPTPTATQFAGLARQIAGDILSQMQPSLSGSGKPPTERREPVVVERHTERVAGPSTSPAPARAPAIVRPSALPPTPPRLRPVTRQALPALRPTDSGTPTVQVTIGRVEVSAVVPSPTVPAPRPAVGPKLTLEAYLRARNGGNR